MERKMCTNPDYKNKIWERPTIKQNWQKKKIKVIRYKLTILRKGIRNPKSRSKAASKNSEVSCFLLACEEEDEGWGGWELGWWLKGEEEEEEGFKVSSLKLEKLLRLLEKEEEKGFLAKWNSMRRCCREGGGEASIDEADTPCSFAAADKWEWEKKRRERRGLLLGLGCQISKTKDQKPKIIIPTANRNFQKKNLSSAMRIYMY